MDQVLENLEPAEYVVSSIQQKQKKKPKPPFTTSSLQQQANYQLNFSSKKTMTIAQQLYEGINLGKEEQELSMVLLLIGTTTNMEPQCLRKA